MAKISRNEVTIVIQVKSGMRLIVMPGARMRRMVTTKLIAPVTEAMPRIERPTIQKSGLEPGEKQPCPPAAAADAAACACCCAVVSACVRQVGVASVSGA